MSNPVLVINPSARRQLEKLRQIGVAIAELQAAYEREMVEFSRQQLRTLGLHNDLEIEGLEIDGDRLRFLVRHAERRVARKRASGT